MTRLLTLAGTLLLTAAALAQGPQQSFTLPDWSPFPAPPESATNVPFANVRARYQQWFPPSQFALHVNRPIAVVGVDVIGGMPGGQNGATMDVAIWMGNGPQLAPGANMDQNLTNAAHPSPLPPVNVLPRSMQTLQTSTPGAPVLQLNFATPWFWDTQSGITFDVRLYDNGRGNLAYSYDMKSTTLGASRVYRMWAASAQPDSAQIATTGPQMGQGLELVFRFVEGATVNYGAGCRGAGSFLPVAATTGGLPLPGNRQWAHTLSKASSNAPALLLLGTSKDSYLGVPLPLNLQFAGAGGCQLLTDIGAMVPVTTIGGGPGTGSATVGTPIPAVTVFIGTPLFAQWWVFDPLALNGLLATSQGLWTVFG